ncbi:MAG: helix-turn-helix transcriptional regulator [Desulfovibrio sp.]|uniref:helix-turn-helix domain-containing protein n=1 Tax=Desulfovibrio sp. TaxID=885 RepID=UPI00135ECCDA|nr:helix-turn-helix transcriptional regulator [Desulfovibrio sp.]
MSSHSVNATILLSQEILAEKIGITQQALARMEQGEIAPKLIKLPELAGALQCTVANLYHLLKETCLGPVADYRPR